MEDKIEYLSNSAEEEDGKCDRVFFNSAEEEDGRCDKVYF